MNSWANGWENEILAALSTIILVLYYWLKSKINKRKKK